VAKSAAQAAVPAPTKVAALYGAAALVGAAAQGVVAADEVRRRPTPVRPLNAVAVAQVIDVDEAPVTETESP